MRVDDLIALADRFVSDGGWPDGWAGVRGALRKAKKAKDAERVRKLTALERKLAPASLAHRIATYVLPEQWGERIQDWAKAAIPKLREDVERARKWEADTDRERDEGFDW